MGIYTPTGTIITIGLQRPKWFSTIHRHPHYLTTTLPLRGSTPCFMNCIAGLSASLPFFIIGHSFLVSFSSLHKEQHLYHYNAQLYHHTWTSNGLFLHTMNGLAHLSVTRSSNLLHTCFSYIVLCTFLVIWVISSPYVSLSVSIPFSTIYLVYLLHFLTILFVYLRDYFALDV